jgi:shikimate kinase
LQALQISKGELDRFLAENKLSAVEEGGERKFRREQVDALKQATETRATIMAGGIDLEEFDIVEDASLGGYTTVEDAMVTLQCSRDEIDQFISEGQLTPIRDAGTIKFQVADVKSLLDQRQQRVTEFATDENLLTREQTLQELQCGGPELDRIVSEGKIVPVDDGGIEKFAADKVSELRAAREKRSTVMRSAEQTMTEDEVVQELGISKGELDGYVAEGKLSVAEDGGTRYFDPGEVYLLRRQLRPSTVIDGSNYITYDEALQELQTTRGELDRMLGEGQLKPYKDQDEIKFRSEDIDELKRALEQKATTLDQGGGVAEGQEDLFLIDEDAESVTLDSVLLDAEGAQEQGEVGEEISVEVEPSPEPGSTVDVEAAAGDEQDKDQTSVIPVSEGGEQAAEEEESIFDFGEEDLDLDSSDSSVVDIKVEMPSDEAQPEAPESSSSMLEIGSGLGLDADESGDLIQIDDEIASSEILPLEEDSDESSADSDIMTDVLQVGEEESSQDDILGDLLEIDEDSEPIVEAEEGAVTAPAFEETVDITETADVTADITQLDEETYEGTDLSEVLGTEEEVSEIYEEQPAAPEQQFAAGTYVAPAGYAEPAVIGGGWVVAMLVVLVLMVAGGMFVFAQSMTPDSAPGFLEKAEGLVKSAGLM